MNFNELLERYVEAATRGGSGSYFLAAAFVSWYRPSNESLVNLYDVTRLDEKNRKLFFDLLYCRENGRFDDELLFSIEQRLKAHWDIK